MSPATWEDSISSGRGPRVTPQAPRSEHRRHDLDGDLMDPIALLTRWGILLVFGSVLLEHGGLPIPAAPLLVAAGALAQDGVMRPEAVLLAALLACLVADHFWFLTGRRYGRRLL